MGDFEKKIRLETKKYLDRNSDIHSSSENNEQKAVVIFDSIKNNLAHLIWQEMKDLGLYDTGEDPVFLAYIDTAKNFIIQGWERWQEEWNHHERALRLPSHAEFDVDQPSYNRRSSTGLNGSTISQVWKSVEKFSNSLSSLSTERLLELQPLLDSTHNPVQNTNPNRDESNNKEVTSFEFNI